MYDNNQNSIQMAGQQTKPNGQNGNNQNNNNAMAINQNLKNDHMANGLTNGNGLLQKQIQQHPQQLLQQQQQIQQVGQQYSQNDLEELTNPEISLDLANFIDDQFRNEQDQFAFFNKVVPVVNGVNGPVVNGVNGIQSEAAKVLQQARFQHRPNPGNALAYMPGCVTGERLNGFCGCVLCLRGCWVRLLVTHKGFLLHILAAEEMESGDNCADPFGGRAEDLTRGSSGSPIVHENN